MLIHSVSLVSRRGSTRSPRHSAACQTFTNPTCPLAGSTHVGTAAPHERAALFHREEDRRGSASASAEKGRRSATKLGNRAKSTVSVRR